MITKEKLVNLLESLKIEVNEGIQSDKNTDKYPRLVYFEYIWEPQTASGTEYNTVVTYQISFFSDRPRDPKLIRLKKKLASNGLLPLIEHEYVEKDRCWHSFFKIDVLENIGDEDIEESV